MTTDSMYVDLDAAFRGADSRYHKKRPHRKPKNLCPSMADDCGTTEDEEEGIIITDDDVMSPHKSTAQLITLVGTDGVAPRRPKGLTVPSANLMKNNTDLASRPYYRRTMTFQSFHLPTRPRRDVGTRSAKVDLKKVHHLQREIPRRNRNTLRKLPLYRMKNDLKRKLHKLERKLSRIKRDEVIEKIAAVKQDPPTPPQVKTPPHITGLISQTFGKSRSAIVRSSSTGRKQYSSRELVQKISESSQNLQQLEYELSARRNNRARSVSNRSSPKSAYQSLPLVLDENSNAVVPSRQLDDDDDDPNGDQPASPKSGSIRTRRVNAKMPTVQPEKKKRRKRKPKKQKANLREFKQEIPIEGMNYVMEVVLEQQLIENTRVGNIDFRKDPKFAVKTTKTTDLRDEFSSYCGQRKGIKNWLFQV